MLKKKAGEIPAFFDALPEHIVSSLSKQPTFLARFNISGYLSLMVNFCLPGKDSIGKVLACSVTFNPSA